MSTTVAVRNSQSYDLRVIPTEITLTFLEYLDYRSLLTCRQVCKLFHVWVDQTASLQYVIELAAANMEDGSNSDLSVSIRLEKLRKYQAAWQKFEFANDKIVPMHVGKIWELYGGVLAQFEGRRTVNLRQLPSYHRGIEERAWTIQDTGINVRDFGMDPAQDLLVLIQMSDLTAVQHIFLRTLSTGTQHPLSCVGGIIRHMQSNTEFHISYTIQISGSYIGIMFISHNDNGRELVVWDWKSGQVTLYIFADSEMQLEMPSFAFLDDRHIILALMADDMPAKILVVEFKASGRKVPLSDLEYTCAFSFPETSDFVVPLDIMIRSDPSPGWIPHRNLKVPFQTASERLFVITFKVTNEHRILPFFLFVPSSTFKSHIKPALEDIKHAIPWEDWGPKGTRFLNLPIPSTPWVCYVYGMRFVVPRVRSSGGRTEIQVYDFNPLFLSRTLPTDRNSVVQILPDRLQSHGAFVEEITTSLPFRVMSVPIDGDWGAANVMCSEDNLIVVALFQPGIGDRSFRVMSF